MVIPFYLGYVTTFVGILPFGSPSPDASKSKISLVQSSPKTELGQYVVRRAFEKAGTSLL